MYPLSRQPQFVTNRDRLSVTSKDVAAHFRSFRKAIENHGPLDDKQRELCLLSGFVVTGNEPGFRVHVNRARTAGATIQELEQAVMSMLGTTVGLVPVVEALDWAHDELGTSDE